MADLVIKVEQQLSDQRSEQIAYKLIVENPSTQPVHLLSVEPRLPSGVQLLEISNSSLAEANAKRATLLTELNIILTNDLLARSEDIRNLYISKQRDAFKEMFSFNTFIRAYMSISLNAINAKVNQPLYAYTVKLSTYYDAKAAYDRWLAKLSDDDAVKSLFQAKLEQLELINGTMTDTERQVLTTMASGSRFTATYVMKFKRSWLEPTKYNLAFDIKHGAPDTPSTQAMSVSETIQISPFPASLSMVAIVSSLLGVLLKLSLAGSADVGQELIGMFKSFNLFVAPIVALIFFNVYEYTSVGKDLTIPLSWRSALLIGALCGLAQDRILAALKAFLGA